MMPPMAGEIVRGCVSGCGRSLPESWGFRRFREEWWKADKIRQNWTKWRMPQNSLVESRIRGKFVDFPCFCLFLLDFFSEVSYNEDLSGWFQAPKLHPLVSRFNEKTMLCFVWDMTSSLRHVFVSCLTLVRFVFWTSKHDLWRKDSLTDMSFCVGARLRFDLKTPRIAANSYQFVMACAVIFLLVLDSTTAATPTWLEG